VNPVGPEIFGWPGKIGHSGLEIHTAAALHFQALQNKYLKCLQAQLLKCFPHA